MPEKEMLVTLSAGSAELLICRRLQGAKDGTVLSDRKVIETAAGKCTILVFSRLFKRAASVFALTVAIEPGAGATKIMWSAQSGSKGLPVVGNLGAAESFEKKLVSALERYRA